MTEGARFFDTGDNFESHQMGQQRGKGPGETLEKPIFYELLGSVTGQDILDLGCGGGHLGGELLAQGCQTYVGLDASEKMAATAERNLADNRGKIIHTRMEDWNYPPSQYDLVVSRLALHYVADLPALFQRVYRTLRPGGRFIFSMVHPVITSSDESRVGGKKREAWLVDHYFETGPRRVFFLGDNVIQYHRPLEDIYAALQRAEFDIEALRESRPRREYFGSDEEFERRGRIPLFVFFGCKSIASRCRYV